MKIAIIELMPVGHFNLVESAIQLFSTDPAHEIRVLCDPFVARDVRAAFGHLSALEVMEQTPSESVSDMLARLDAYQPDISLITTLETHIPAFYAHKWTGSVWLVIHNIDMWFENEFWTNCKRFLARTVSAPRQIKYWLKLYFTEAHLKRKLLGFLLRGDHKFLVLNAALRRELQQYVPLEKTRVLPFSLYTGSLPDGSGANKTLRICIPGYVTQLRRDYLGVLQMIQDHAEKLAGVVSFDFLGAADFSHPQTRNILDIARRCTEQGVLIHTYEQRPSAQVFDENLGKCDLILGNIVVQINRFTRYGKTKESGLPFAMIKAAKPGLMPREYDSFPELTSSTLFYDTYPELAAALMDLVEHPEKMERLKEQAKLNSLQFTPEKIYQTFYP